jgi:hypothetical protein
MALLYYMAAIALLLGFLSLTARWMTEPASPLRVTILVSYFAGISLLIMVGLIALTKLIFGAFG